jgi:small-conductance mechanosensitive channel
MNPDDLKPETVQAVIKAVIVIVASLSLVILVASPNVFGLVLIAMLWFGVIVKIAEWTSKTRSWEWRWWR